MLWLKEHCSSVPEFEAKEKGKGTPRPQGKVL
jgi:hypothetical protein